MSAKGQINDAALKYHDTERDPSEDAFNSSIISSFRQGNEILQVMDKKHTPAVEAIQEVGP